MEVGRRGGRVADRHIVLGAQGEVPLDARRRVVRALTLEAMGEQQDHRGALTPLLLGTGDELVDDGLGAIGEVAELRLPEHQRVGSFDRVAVLKAHGRELGKQ